MIRVLLGLPLLILLLVLGLRAALPFAGSALAIGFTLAVADLVWSVSTDPFGWLALGILLGWAIRVAVGRAWPGKPSTAG
jgi:hypothetical protein